MAQQNLLPVEDDDEREVAPTTTAPVVAQPVLSNVQAPETVRGQLRDLLKTGNPLLEQSRNRAVTYAAGRGLQNTTLAAQAGEEAFVSQALPIATQDATTYSNRALLNVDAQNRFGLQAQSGDISSRLQGEQGDISSRLQSEQGTIASRLQGEQGDINSRLQREQAGFRTGELQLQADIERQLSSQNFQQQQSLMVNEYAQRLNLSAGESRQQIERMNLQHTQTLEQIEANGRAQSGIDSAKFSRDLGGAYLTAVTNRQTAASQEIASIYQTQGLTSAQQQTGVSNAYARMQLDVQALAAYYRMAPAWDSNWATGATPGATPGAPTGGFPAPGGAPQQSMPTPTREDLLNSGATQQSGGRAGNWYTLPGGQMYFVDYRGVVTKR